MRQETLELRRANEFLRSAAVFGRELDPARGRLVGSRKSAWVTGNVIDAEGGSPRRPGVDRREESMR